MKTEFLFNHNNFYPKYAPSMPVLMIIIPMVVISMSILAKKQNNKLGNTHSNNILGGYYTYHLFYLFLRFGGAFEQLARQH